MGATFASDVSGAVSTSMGLPKSSKRARLRGGLLDLSVPELPIVERHAQQRRHDDGIDEAGQLGEREASLA
ncbi:MAG TPA: hypothetical protein VG963_10455 [Polyangiaceae bacterium]|nr:hypothetical protein [Polyangiaceae bacterium]